MIGTGSEGWGGRPGEEVIRVRDGKSVGVLPGTGTPRVHEIPRLSHEERREIMRRLIQAEQDAAVLAECDLLALQRFQMLDALEAENEKNASR